MKNRLLLFALLLSFSVFYACSPRLTLPAAQQAASALPGSLRPFPGYESLSDADRLKADSLVARALDHEALYSLMANLKPMSSIGTSLSFPLGKDSTHAEGEARVVATETDSLSRYLHELESWNRVLHALSFGPYRFLLIPFRQVWNGKRNLQMLVCRTDLLDSLLTAQASFFAQWGFVPGTDPAVVLTAIEFENKYDRFRAYGYLFGYPSHAVDFFVEASRSEAQTGEFVKRDFFSIPVHRKDTGYFTYAVPKEYQPTSTDETLRQKASATLASYRSLRPLYLNGQGGLEAIRLFREWYAQKP